ncbi:MAG: hypothetical protein ABL952_15000 [Pyrinomonadaceae bacterium]
MKRTVLVFASLVIFSTLVFGQETGQTKSAELSSTTQRSAQLQNSLDVTKAKPGDQVVLKTVRDVKDKGAVVVQKGSQLIGRVTEVQQKTKENAMSRIGVVFDQLRTAKGNLIPITSSIISISQAQASLMADDTSADLFASSSTSSSTSAGRTSSGGSGGGLLSGVGNTAGGVVSRTTQTLGTATRTVSNVADTAVGTTTSALGTTTTTLGSATSNIRGLSISQSADATASGGSTLSLSKGNLKLEKGATFNMNVSQSSSVKAN